MKNETEVNLDPLTKTEIQLAVTQLKYGKAAGLDYINPEVLKVDRLCGLVVRVSGYRYRGLGFDSRRYQIF